MIKWSWVDTVFTVLILAVLGCYGYYIANYSGPNATVSWGLYGFVVLLTLVGIILPFMFIQSGESPSGSAGDWKTIGGFLGLCAVSAILFTMYADDSTIKLIRSFNPVKDNVASPTPVLGLDGDLRSVKVNVPQGIVPKMVVVQIELDDPTKIVRFSPADADGKVWYMLPNGKISKAAPLKK